ncbi:Uncharacterised protein [Mycobacterium tuberculosis]|uniref:Uncharacterized protein n=1 Tax=Mycobacterium tuberculosis TaxID=1773 RepID=A0A916PCD1_MYCTX|nr:Uncharacterised protein [Mycobacterium tuberculosis]COY48820.1 Uncharacterised protein [Mycobacterium tuberculosis]COZ34324.1 Uncharacterised protein [Mycobacterium tuberculosis]
MTEVAVGDFAAHFGHRFTDSGDEDSRNGIGLRLGCEHRGHDLVGVELTLEAKLGPVLPSQPDRTQRGDEFTHPTCRMTPGHAESFLDVRPDLGSQTEDQSSLRVRL